jgi:hypothetical protein
MREWLQDFTYYGCKGDRSKIGINIGDDFGTGVTLADFHNGTFPSWIEALKMDANGRDKEPEFSRRRQGEISSRPANKWYFTIFFFINEDIKIRRDIIDCNGCPRKWGEGVSNSKFVLVIEKVCIFVPLRPAKFLILDHHLRGFDSKQSATLFPPLSSPKDSRVYRLSATLLV